MAKTIISKDDTFGKLTVIERAENKNGRAMYLCSCSCGSEPRAYLGYSLVGGGSKSCGCARIETLASKRQDLIGKTFGRLTVQSPKMLGDGTFSGKWNCVCECGNHSEVSTASLNNGNSQSCGCLSIDRSREVLGTHLMAGTPEYYSWSNMKARCLNVNSSNYSRYGGRGITVCDEWKDSFEAFYADMGPRPEGASLDRIDNDGNYEKSNCRWATKIEQANNTSTNRMLTAFGKTQSMADWAREQGLTHSCIKTRINRRGWDVEKALTTPSARKSKVI